MTKYTAFKIRLCFDINVVSSFASSIQNACPFFLTQSFDMANGSAVPPGLSFSRETFATLTPRPFLHAHLKQPSPVRPNGRLPKEFRKPTINTGSLTHSNGSAVVRSGDTAIVCGVRGEILLASNIPRPPSDDIDENDLIEELGLLVPNLELSTGCSPAHLPGNPPSTQAQSLSYRILSLLHHSNLISPADLCIEYTEPPNEEDLPDEGPKTVAKAYWTLYIDILCIALDGNAFDTAWTAVLAALQNVILPRAWWDPDRESIICSPLAVEGHSLQLNGLPVPSTFAVFTTATPLKKNDAAESWVLLDPDAFEEDVADEVLTVVLTPMQDRFASILRLEKSGGSRIDHDVVTSCLEMAESKSMEWRAILKGR